MSFPNWREWLYSAKAFVAAMLALFIALAGSLPNPYWSVVTVYIVSHPLSGATRSKSVYRVFGTVLGAAAAVAMVPNLSQAPVLLCVAMALWIAGMMYLALLDRTPRSYVCMLAAYTMPLIGLPTLMQPDTIFDVALARSEEILLGIVCVSVVNTVLFPNRVAPVVSRQMAQLTRAAAEWSAAVLAIREPFGAPHAQRNRLLADVAALDGLIKQLSYDSTHYGEAEHVRQMRLRMTMLIPQVSALFDPLLALRRQQGPRLDALRALVARLTAWMHEGSADDPDAAAAALRGEAAAIAAALPAERAMDDALVSNALMRVGELIDLWQDCMHLQRVYASRAPLPPLRYRSGQLIGTTLHYDHGLLLFSACAAAGAALVASLAWIALGWPAGAGGVILAAVSCCFFAAQDNPAPMIGRFLYWVVVSVLLAGVYLFAVLPRVDSFPVLAASLALPLLLAGAFTGRPQLNMSVLLFTSQTIADLQLNNSYNADFQSFANSSLSSVLGLVFAIAWTTVTRPFGAEVAARRLTHDGWRDLVGLSSASLRDDHTAAAARLIDRTTQLLPRLGLIRDQSLARMDAVRDLRIGLRILDLQRLRRTGSAAVEEAIGAVLRELSAHYAECIRRHHPLDPPPSLRARLDAGIGRLLHATDEACHDAVQALIGLRLAMFPDLPARGEAAPLDPLSPSPVPSRS
ncbi:FUSC family protein [Frateuria defendens]|uniref:FUSC family protein n=1 Tax=Frateuria defendens TaxID=2219559 RepID=UPI00066FFB51|nr:FUSC family protein [Frateuria defendens]